MRAGQSGVARRMAEDRAASALGWWIDAGVDTIVAETPRNWLKPVDTATAQAQAPAPAAALPGDLAGFRHWLLNGDDVPLGAPATRRLGPLGDPASGLMVLIDMPGTRDSLLAGEAGARFERMMTAIGRDLESIYLATLAPARTPTGLLSAEEVKALAPIARHHVGLVAPRALLLFGDACARALLGAPLNQTRGRWHEVATAAGPVPTIATIRSEDMDRTPGLKKAAWADLQMLMEGLKA